jgi:hypothetical protein
VPQGHPASFIQIPNLSEKSRIVPQFMGLSGNRNKVFLLPLIPSTRSLKSVSLQSFFTGSRLHDPFYVSIFIMDKIPIHQRFDIDRQANVEWCL